MRAFGSLLVVAACGGAQPVTTTSITPPPAVTGQLVETTTPDGDGVRIRIDGTDLPLAQLPIADWAVLPMTGTGTIHVDLHVPVVDGHRQLSNADGDITLACPNGCALGNDHARIWPRERSPRAQSFASDGIEFGHVAFDHVAIAVHVAHGHAQITQWQVASPDVDVDLAMQWQLGATYDDSLVSGCLRFAVKPALAQAQPKTAAVVETTGASAGTDAHFHIALTGRAGDLRVLARDCTGGEPIAAVDEPPPPAPPSLPEDGRPDTADGSGASSGSDGITKIDDHTYDIARAAFDRVLDDPATAAKGVRVVPAVKNGKPDGFKLYAIRPDSIYARLGFLNGDTVHAINGFELTSADQALEVYKKLREATAIEVTVTRRGQNVTLTYRIR